MRTKIPRLMGCVVVVTMLILGVTGHPAAPGSLHGELIFPLEHWHNHASCIVEAPNGDLIVCWFHGSGERTADDVRIEGSRKRKGTDSWEPRFTLADTPGYPDTNCTMFIDPQGRLWLLYPTILANRWETALMKYHISSDYLGSGPPKWDRSGVLHFIPPDDFERAITEFVEDQRRRLGQSNFDSASLARVEEYFELLQSRAADKLSRRLGWMTRAHPFVLDNRRLIVPLYSDGFDGSIMAISDDWGQTWRPSNLLLGGGNIQPSIVRRRDGTLYTLMRDNGPPPKRLHQSQSTDEGQTWGPVTDSQMPNPGSGAEITSLRNGNWVLISNDTESGRHSLAVQFSDDEGRSWKWTRHLEFDRPGPEAGAYHYPSIIQAQDGSLHATYSYHLNRKDLPLNGDGLPARKSIKHVRFDESWVKAGGDL